MSDEHPMMVGAATVFVVTDMAKSWDTIVTCSGSR
jgi:hypothetical protein